MPQVGQAIPAGPETNTTKLGSKAQPQDQTSTPNLEEASLEQVAFKYKYSSSGYESYKRYIYLQERRL